MAGLAEHEQHRLGDVERRVHAPQRGIGEQLAGDLSTVLDARYLVVDRNVRFHPVKTPADLEAVRPRLQALLAASGGAITLDFRTEDIYDRIQELTAGRGADACIDAVGTEPDTRSGFDAVIDSVKVATFMGTDRPHVLGQAIHCCRNFGTVSIVGVYGGFLDKIPMGSAINRGLTFRMAQTPVQHYMPKLLERIENGEIDPSFVITHRATLEEGPELYKTFRAKEDGCIKVVMTP